MSKFSVSGSQLRLNDTKIIRWLFAFYCRKNTMIQFGCLSLSRNMNGDTYTKQLNWLLETKK